MPLTQWGPWSPDCTDYEGPGVFNINNVVPRGDGYGPFPSFSTYTQTLPAACRGAFYALKSDGTVVTFAGTSSHLWQLNNTDTSWTPVSLPVAVASITNANPAVINYTAHGKTAGSRVVFGGTVLPAHIVAGTVYYVIAAGLTANAFEISATSGGTAISTLGDSGSGTPTVTSSYASLSANANWQFAQAGNLVFATQANAVLQVFDLSSPGAFAVALGSPPQAAYISVVGRFLVLSGLLSAPYRIQWSGLNSFNASASWTSGTNSSDFQDFPDGGIVRGVAGGDQSGIVFQDQAIRRMSYVPGSPIIFQIDRLTQDKGLFAPYSIVRAGEKTFFYAGQGFHKIEPGSPPVQIGRERVDRTFLTDLDRGNLQLFIGAADPRSSRVYWAYKSNSGTVGLYDKILGYDFVLDKFFPLTVSGEFLLGISQTGLTLENLDSLSASIDAMTLSLDNYATAVQPQIAQFNSSGVLGFFSGPNLEATITGSEQGTDGQKIFLKGFRVITDAATLYGTTSYRDTQGASPVTSTETQMSTRTGRVDIRRDARYQRFGTRIPAGQVWNFSAGYEADVTTSGTQ